MARHSGIGVYIRHLVPRIAALRPSWRWRLLGVPPASGLDGIEAELVAVAAPIYSLREFQTLRRATRGADLVWSPHYNAAIRAEAPLLVTVHDVIPLAMPSGRLKSIYARILLQLIRRRAAGVMFVSAFSRAEFVRHVGSPLQANWIVPAAVGDIWRKPTLPQREGGDYVVAVGSVKPHKNLGVLLDAFAEIASTLPIELRIVGRTEGLRGLDHQALATASAHRGRVTMTGEIDDAALVQTVAGARALVFPSLYEGFGLPPIEAMAVGCPVIAADIPAVREVCGDAALYFDPRSSNDLHRQMLAVLNDATLREDLRQRGFSQAARYDWDRSAAQVVEAMEAILATRRRRSSP
jgi:glycosyltransferase involved in cell wall biosynthesis